MVRTWQDQLGRLDTFSREAIEHDLATGCRLVGRSPEEKRVARAWLAARKREREEELREYGGGAEAGSRHVVALAQLARWIGLRPALLVMIWLVACAAGVLIGLLAEEPGAAPKAERDTPSSMIAHAVGAG